MCVRVCVCVWVPTLVEPVGQAVEDDPLVPRGHQADGGATDCRSVVDVVLEYEHLPGNRRTNGRTAHPVNVSLSDLRQI